MKRNNRNRTRTILTPVRIQLSEAEIMADLQYPATIERPVNLPPSKKTTTAS